jgi:hypothetical protein
MPCIKNTIPAHKIMAAIIISGPNHGDGHGHRQGHGHSSHHHIIMIASNHEREGKSG